ncbi:hypothetical protein L596_012487 [Steinernema carpocapsae]|uniref:Uncharacterized protein n=1 Tax=Steinernema carpocapsae TaxID=34508 RepID=A0A4U5NXF1_STECR|nr:hypothetical protein L596_012487 [Steinernema carpocapsae]
MSFCDVWRTAVFSCFPPSLLRCFDCESRLLFSFRFKLKSSFEKGGIRTALLFGKVSFLISLERTSSADWLQYLQDSQQSGFGL